MSTAEEKNEQLPPIDSGKIRVADVTLAQLSRGLYRSTATVFKELVNNSYDADAEEVRINTNFPNFDFISCVDNGKGMPLSSFIKHFSAEGIGSSTKRKGQTQKTEKFGRPIIGRLGIGMMAIGQLCHSFDIESHYLENGVGKAYRGKIILTDDDIPTLAEEETQEDFLGKEIDVGQWEYELLKFDESKKGFRIYSNDVRGTFTRDMKKSFSEVEALSMPFSLEKIMAAIYSNSSVRERKRYIETIWELTSLCPLPYYENELSPVRFADRSNIQVEDFKVLEFLEEKQKALIEYDFQLYFDGIHLKRIIQLPSETNINCKLYNINFQKKVFDTDLVVKGYIFSQIPRAIRPMELNGLQIRLRNVGIGGYDSTFLKYYNKIETIRSKWISGEIFVEKGLEAALNIDRDSFNEHEEHYKAMQSYIHQFMDTVFDDARKASSDINKEKKIAKLNSSYEKLKDIVIKETQGKYTIEEVSYPENKESVIFDSKNKKIFINSGSKSIRSQSKEKIFRLMQIAYLLSDDLNKTKEDKDAFFSKILLEIIQELL